MRKLFLALALILVTAPAFAQVTADVGQGYTFVKDQQGRVIYGWGVPPSSYESLPVGTPFWNVQTYAFYYWSGTAWTISGAAGSSLVFEGATVDASETTISITDPTADRTITVPDGSGTVMLSSLATNGPDVAASVWGVSNRLDFEGATANDYETEITATDPTADRLFTLPDDTGTAMISTLATNSTTAANSVWGISNALVFEGATGGADAFETSITVVDPTADNTFTLPNASGVPVISTLSTNAPDAANAIWTISNSLVFEGASGGADAFETSITVVDPTADNTFTLPNYSGVPLISTYTSNVPDGADSIWAVQGALYFEGTSGDGFEAVFTVTNPTADNAINFPNYGGTVLMSSTANEPDTANAFWVNTGELKFEGSTANAFETTVGVVDPTAARTIYFPNESGTVLVRSAKSLYTLIQGGYTLSGTTTASPASTVKVTIVDTTPTITDGDIQVCGYTTAGNQTNLVKTCELLDFSGGGGNQTTGTSFIEITNVKASSFATLGGAGDETVAAEFTTGPVAIFAATNLVNSSASDFTSSPITVAETLWSPVCLDLQGCNVEPADLTSASDGRTLTVIGRDATQNLVFTDSANMDIGAAGALTLGVGDAIQLMYNSVNAKAWVEISRSNN